MDKNFKHAANCFYEYVIRKQNFCVAGLFINKKRIASFFII